MNNNFTVQIDSGYFCAGLVVAGSQPARVVEAAPVLKWTLGKPWGDVAAYAQAKGWKVSVLPAKA